jgi:hypothetical protein
LRVFQQAFEDYEESAFAADDESSKKSSSKKKKKESRGDDTAAVDGARAERAVLPPGVPRK